MIALAALALALAGGFSARIDNPYFALEPGTTYRYRGTEEGSRSLDVVSVTHRVRRIAGGAFSAT